MKRKIIPTLLLLASLFSCTDHQTKPKPHDGFDITGPWVLTKITYADGTVNEMQHGYTRCKFFESDSTYFSIEINTFGNETVIRPHEWARYQLHITPEDTVYIENGRLTQFEIIDDSTFTTVWDGYLETMRRVKTMTESRQNEIKAIVRNKTDDDGKILREYVLSTSERELKNTISTYHYIFIILLLAVLLVISYAINIMRRKREIERNLQAIKEERNRPALVSDAIRQVENDFFQSDYYQQLRQRIAAGENMTIEDWEEMERQLNAVYTGFSRKLRSLYNFSDTEFHVCLLTKLRATNKDIAAVINRAPDSVSSIRSRLHKKVLGPHGGAKEWDEFVLSL